MREILQNHETAAQLTDQFLAAYDAQVSQEISLLNHTAETPFYSYPKCVKSRIDAQRRYILGQEGTNGDYCWGRTILAEQIGTQLLKIALNNAIATYNWVIKLAPSNMDASVYIDDSCYQKGFDVCILATEGQYNVGQYAIDWTIGDQYLVVQKEARPLISLRASMGGGVISLRNFWTDEYRHFHKFIDSAVVPQIKQKGCFAIDELLSQKDLSKWKKIMLGELKRGVGVYLKSLRNPNFPTVCGHQFSNDSITRTSHFVEIVRQCEKYVS